MLLGDQRTLGPKQFGAYFHGFGNGPFGIGESVEGAEPLP